MLFRSDALNSRILLNLIGLSALPYDGQKEFVAPYRISAHRELKDFLKQVDRKNEPADSLRACELEQALCGFARMLDFEKSGEKLDKNIKDCRAFLRPWLQCRNGSTAPVMHVVGHAHIDLEWLWPIEETQRKCARTMAAQLRHMDEYPEYRMLLSQPYLYEVIRERYPELFVKMKEKIRNGQLICEGGMWVEADVNLPSGESLIRQLVYGKKYFKEELGCDSSLLWLPDVFGYSAALL